MVKILNDHVEIDPPKKTKKLTGTRFATVLGLNPWSTPFEIWCQVTKTHEKPFEDTIYTIAGKAIEPKQAEFMKSNYLMDLVSPTDMYGENYFRKTWGDFYPEQPVLGGMWDYLQVENGETTAVLEMKTTKRSEDWKRDIPMYYALQASLYAYLLGVDDVIMVCSFLDPGDYDHPDKFEPSIYNTIVRQFKVSQKFPEFPDYVKQVIDWWERHVVTGISPKFDEKADADILKVLRTNQVDNKGNLSHLIVEAEALKTKLDAVKEQISTDEKKLKALESQIKAQLCDKFRDGDQKVQVSGEAYNWIVSKTTSQKVDEKALKADGLFDQYLKTNVTYTLRKEGKS